MPRGFTASLVAAFTATVLIGIPIALFGLLLGIYDALSIMSITVGLFMFSWAYVGLVGVPVFALARRMIAFSYARAFWLGVIMANAALWLFILMPKDAETGAFSPGLSFLVIAFMVSVVGGITGLAYWDSWSRRDG